MLLAMAESTHTENKKEMFSRDQTTVVFENGR